MKTPTNSRNRPARHLLKNLKALLPLLAAGGLVSCGTQSIGTTHTNPPTANLGHQIKAQLVVPTVAPQKAAERNLAWDRSLQSGEDYNLVPLLGGSVSW